MEQNSDWLSQDQMRELFGHERSVITKYLRNIFVKGEFNIDSVCANFAHTAEDGKIYHVMHYNLNVVISVGYRAISVQDVAYLSCAGR